MVLKAVRADAELRIIAADSAGGAAGDGKNGRRPLQAVRRYMYAAIATGIRKR